jgi:phosphate transport system protein
LQKAEDCVLSNLRTISGLLRQATGAAATGQGEAADQVTARSSELEERYGDVHNQLLALIARQSPVAGDLRLTTALLHVNDRIARMGAQCVNIATLSRAIPDGERPSNAQLDCLEEMARLVDEQIIEAARIFAERDAAAAPALCERDLRINEHNRQCFALAVHDGTSESRREVAFFVALMARALERIGDNAVDIGQQAAFAATGELRLTPFAGHPRASAG